MANGINFSPVATDTAESMDSVVKYILGLKISPQEKISRITTSFELVGSDFYVQMFDANSELFDSTAIGADYNKMTDQIERLSRKIVQNDNLGRPVDVLVKDFYDSALGLAQDEAFKNAVSLDKHPTLTRSIVGETCQWCVDLAGVHLYPDGEMFRRHANCDCLFVTSGYNSRNGILTNYSKNTKFENLTSAEARKKIGVSQQYWSKEMTDGERWFAKNYTQSIKWIDKNVRNEMGKRIPTNDYKLLANNQEYELKTSTNLKYKTIKENIKVALSSDVKSRFMVSTMGKKMPDSVKRKLINYAVNNNLIKELRIFDSGGEEVLVSKT